MVDDANGVMIIWAQKGVPSVMAVAPAMEFGNAPSGEPFVGAIDSLRLFRVARTPAQIAAAAVK